MTENPKITIRLPGELAEKLAATAERFQTTRTAILLDLLASGIDAWEPAQQRPTLSDTERLNGEIEALRGKLSEAIERIEIVERRTTAQQRPTVDDDVAQRRPTTAQQRPTLFDSGVDASDAVTIGELCERYGWSRANAARSARANGWEKVGKRGVQTLWVRAD